MKELTISELKLVVGGNTGEPVEPDLYNYGFAAGVAMVGAAVTGVGAPLVTIAGLTAVAEAVVYDLGRSLPISVNENQLPNNELIPSSLPIGPNYGINNNQSGSDYNSSGCNYC